MLEHYGVISYKVKNLGKSSRTEPSQVKYHIICIIQSDSQIRKQTDKPGYVVE